MDITIESSQSGARQSRPIFQHEVDHDSATSFPDGEPTARPRRLLAAACWPRRRQKVRVRSHGGRGDPEYERRQIARARGGRQRVLRQARAVDRPDATVAGTPYKNGALSKGAVFIRA